MKVMNFELSTFAISTLLFLGMVTCSEIGRQLAHRRNITDQEGGWHGSSVIDAAVFGLLGLIVAFTFSSAASRFDVRRNLIVQEANAIGTAHLRLDLLPAGDQPEIRKNFRDYVDSRIRVYTSLPDIALARKELATGRTTAIENMVTSAARRY